MTEPATPPPTWAKLLAYILATAIAIFIGVLVYGVVTNLLIPGVVWILRWSFR